jgi:hypothetical protein
MSFPNQSAKDAAVAAAQARVNAASTQPEIDAAAANLAEVRAAVIA